MALPSENISDLLTEVFNDIVRIEEQTLKRGTFKDTSVTEMHTVEAIGMYERKPMSQIAHKLEITIGTLTVAINNLVNKGYVERHKEAGDRRVVKIGLTSKGRLLYRIHDKFHMDLLREATGCLSDEEKSVLKKALAGLHSFLTESYGNVH